MKRIKFFLLALAIVALLVSVGWILRNSIVQQISNPILADYDLELTDVSIEALTASSAKIRYLKLLHAQGTVIEIESLTLPVNAVSDSMQVYSARRVTIETPAANEKSPLQLAQWINQLLSLSDSVAGKAIQIARLELPIEATVHNLKWEIHDDSQLLSVTIDSVDLSFGLSQGLRGAYRAIFTVLNLPGSGDSATTIEAKLQRHARGISIVGQCALTLPQWQSVAMTAGIVPENLEFVSGTGDAQFELDIPLDVSRASKLTATLTPSSAWQLRHRNELGGPTTLEVASDMPLLLSAGFPELDWSLQQEQFSAIVTNDQWGRFPLSVETLSCQSGPSCSLALNISWPNAQTSLGSAARIQFFSELKLAFTAEGFRAELQPNASLELFGVSTHDKGFDRVEAKLNADLTLLFLEDGWQISADSIDATIESLLLTTDTTLSASLYLEKIQAASVDEFISASGQVYTPSIRLNIDGQKISTPGTKGAISLQNTLLAIDMTTVNLLNDGTIRARHDLDSGIGELKILDTVVTFEAAPLSTRITPWENDWDVSGGNLAIDLQANWEPMASGVEFGAQASVGIDTLAGYYADVAFVGFSSNLDLSYNANSITLSPMSIRVELLDMGLPIENITADIKSNIDKWEFDVDNLRMSAFNGTLHVAPFSFHTAREVNNVVLTAENLDLAELLTTEEFADVDVTGTISAVLPVTIAQDGISIDGGTLSAEAPGGVIRYLGGGNSGAGVTSSLDLVTTALSNFVYESLEADVNYSRTGDLKLQMKISGRNPELDDSRPVVLNLGVENNVPQMLKSLQAARAVEDILEKRLID